MAIAGRGPSILATPADSRRRARPDRRAEGLRSAEAVDDSWAVPHYLIKRGGYRRFTGSYPMFADFVHLSSDNGQLAVYHTQLEREIFVPARLELKGADVNGPTRSCVLARVRDVGGTGQDLVAAGGPAAGARSLLPRGSTCPTTASRAG